MKKEPKAREVKALEPWQQEDAKRLRAIWDKRQPKISQQDFGSENEIGSQGLVWQYIEGKIALNLEASIRFAKGLGVTVDSFSPKLAELLAMAPGTKGPEKLPRDEHELLTRYRDADPRWKLSLRLLATVATEDQFEAAGDVNLVLARISGRALGASVISDQEMEKVYNFPPGHPKRTTARVTRK